MAGSAVMVALVAGYWGASPWLAVLAGWSVGLTTGLINGLLVTKTNVPSFIVTLAMQFFMLGLTLGLVRLITGDTTIRVETDSPVKEIFGGKFANQFENAIFWAIGFAIVLAWLLQKSRWGNWIFAIGGDPVSARAMGVQVEKTKVALFMFTGFGASTLGIVTTFLYNGTSTSAGQAYVFNSVIAVVLGGVLLTGGYGSVIGVIFGTLTFAIVNQGVYYTGWDSDWAALILGILLLIAVLMNNAFRRLALSGGSRKKEVKK
jgi:simple sugar transport system permease protein